MKVRVMGLSQNRGSEMMDSKTKSNEIKDAKMVHIAKETAELGDEKSVSLSLQVSPCNTNMFILQLLTA